MQKGCCALGAGCLPRAPGVIVPAVNVEFWFDFSCPYAYLASQAVEEICAQAGATLQLRPMLLGGVFRATGAGDGPMATLTPRRALNNSRDMHRWAEWRGVTLRIPAAHPIRTVRALRTLLGLPEARWPAAMHALYAAYWQAGADITDDAVIAAALTVAGVPAAEQDAARRGADTDAVKDDLRRRTDEAVALGIFGAPAMVVRRPDGPVLLWGQDRLHWLAAVLAGWDPERGSPAAVVSAQPHPRLERLAPDAPGLPLDFWFDYASPFAYLGATQIARIARAAGTTVRWRPMLLGALFREVGSPDVPLFGLPPAKRAFVARELTWWARWWGVDFRFNTRFPVRTVNALRVTLLAGEHQEALIARIFRAIWVDDHDVTDPEVLRGLCAEVGVDPAVVDRTSEPAVKQVLVDQTAAAVKAGVFGAPTAIVHGANGPLLFWGQDRLDLVAAALRGWRPTVG